MRSNGKPRTPLASLVAQKFAMPVYATFFEVTDATGMRQTGFADAISMSTWPSRGLELIGFEFKASRSDWLRELKNPLKSEKFIRYCHRWYLVAADKSVAKDEEIPSTWGLLIPHGNGLSEVVKAPKLEPIAPSYEFLASILRRSRESQITDADLNRRYTDGVAQGKREAERQLRVDKTLDRKWEEIQQRNQAIIDALGCNINEWPLKGIPGGRIADAIREIVSGRYRSESDVLGCLHGYVQQVADGIAARIKTLDAVSQESP